MKASKETANTAKQKALASALSQIEKQFGKGSIMRYGDGPAQKIDVISTGSPALDGALGIGGVPRGRVVEIYGPEASGKCLTKDTYIWTQNGMETIEEVFEHFGQKASCTSKITSVEDKNYHLVNERNEMEQMIALTHNNKRKVLKVTTEKGREIKGTLNHPLRVMNERGQVVWRNIGDLKTGDYLMSGLFGAETSNNNSSELSETEAAFIGYLVSEGTLCESVKHRFCFSNHNPQVVDDYYSLCQELFNKVPTSYFNNTEHHMNDTKLREELVTRYGLAYGKSKDKNIPHCVRTSSTSSKKAFLSALFEGDGSIEKSRGVITYCSASEKLAREVQLMLMGFGIASSIRCKKVKGYSQNYWEVGMGPSAAKRFVDTIGFRSNRRKDQWAECKEHTYANCIIENIPNMALKNMILDLRDNIKGDRELSALIEDVMRGDMELSVSKTRLTKIIAWFDEREDKMLPPAKATLEALRFLANSNYTYEKVEKIQDMGLEPTFDVAMSSTHSFLANGILSHNTTVTLQIIAEAQKSGGICAFIDAEHALDPGYAAKLGVDMDNLLLSQPDTGEQALEIVEKLTNSNALDLIVIDSVAALTPKAEIAGEMGDSLPGLHARLMSQALRKITAAVSKSKTTVIFINQIRHKIGMMMPGQSPETTTGGNALKFYASVRMDVRRIGGIKKGDEHIGNQVRVRIIKNKMAPPFKNVVRELYFGEGFSVETEVLDMAVDEGVMTRAGAFYRYNDTVVGQGKENARNYLKENPDVMDEIKSKLKINMPKDEEVKAGKDDKED